MNLPSIVVTVTVHFYIDMFKKHILKQTMAAINMNNGF
jgi:hypothetical protein